MGRTTTPNLDLDLDLAGLCVVGTHAPSLPGSVLGQEDGDEASTRLWEVESDGQGGDDLVMPFTAPDDLARMRRHGESVPVGHVAAVKECWSSSSAGVVAPRTIMTPVTK